PVTVRQFRAFTQAADYQTDAESEGGGHRWTSDDWERDPDLDWTKPGYPQGEDHPVSCVSWNDAQAFLEWLSGLQKEKEAGRASRLPSEAEWESACRAGTTTPFALGISLSSAQANFDGNYPYGEADEGVYIDGTCPVGSYRPNAFGLYDMHGQVWEWCADWHGRTYYRRSPRIDPPGPARGESRALR